MYDMNTLLSMYGYKTIRSLFFGIFFSVSGGKICMNLNSCVKILSKLLWLILQNTFQWEPEMEMRVRAQYNKVARARFTGSVNYAKRWWQSCCKDPEYARNHKTWIPEDLLLGYINYWKSTEAEVKSLTASQNRDKGEKVNYLGGSIGIDGHREKLVCYS